MTDDPTASRPALDQILPILSDDDLSQVEGELSDAWVYFDKADPRRAGVRGSLVAIRTEIAARAVARATNIMADAAALEFGDLAPDDEILKLTLTRSNP